MLFQVRLDLPLDRKWKHFCNFPPHPPLPSKHSHVTEGKAGECVCVSRAETLLGEWGEVLHLPNIPAVPAKRAHAIAMAGEAASSSWGQGHSWEGHGGSRNVPLHVCTLSAHCLRAAKHAPLLWQCNRNDWSFRNSLHFVQIENALLHDRNWIDKPSYGMFVQAFFSFFHLYIWWWSRSFMHWSLVSFLYQHAIHQPSCICVLLIQNRVGWISR